jgi:hypothetical protein
MIIVRIFVFRLAAAKSFFFTLLFSGKSRIEGASY